MQELADELAEIEERLAQRSAAGRSWRSCMTGRLPPAHARSHHRPARTEMEQDIAEKGEASPYLAGADDLVIEEFHLPLRKEANC